MVFSLPSAGDSSDFSRFGQLTSNCPTQPCSNSPQIPINSILCNTDLGTVPGHYSIQ